MNALSVSEIQKLVLELRAFEGFRLQDVRIYQSLIALGFYSEGLTWLIIDLNLNAPQVVHLPDLALIEFRAEKKPVQLYLKAHFLGLRLERVEAPPDFGRVLNFYFSKDKFIEIRLFPHGQNLLVHFGNTAVSFFKPQILKEIESSVIVPYESGAVLSVKSEEWLAEKNSSKKTARGEQKSSESIKLIKTEKIKKAIKKISEDISAKENEPWAEVGQWLKSEQTLDVPVEFVDYIDRSQSFSENLEKCFKKAKDNKLKIIGAKKRILELQAELSDENLSSAGFGRSNIHRDTKPSALRLSGAKGRTFVLEDNIILFVGKSADDNLRLLRQAKPWFYWLHLRDRPSCHGLIHRNKSQKLSDAILHLAAHHLIANNFGEKKKSYVGDKFDIIVTECRFVRPIKGDRHGRVHFTDERSFTHLFQN